MKNGLLDFISTPEGQGLLSAAFGGLAGARRGQPINSLGRAGLAGLAGYSGAQDRVLQQDEAAVQKQYRDMQMQTMQNQQAQLKAQQDWRSGLSGAMKQMEPTYGAGDEGPTMTPGNPNALQDYAMRPGSPIADDMLKQLVMPKARETVTVGNVVLDKATMKPVYTAPEKFNPNQPFMVVDGKVVSNKAYQDYELGKADRGATRIENNVNTGQRDVQWGTPPKDMVWARDQSGNIVTERDAASGALRPLALPVAGSTVDQGNKSDAAKATERANTARAAAGNVLAAVKEADGLIGGFTTGAGSTLAGIPGTSARNLQSKLETIKANLGFDRLQQMREQSPTGGALGAVAVQELTALQSTVASLDQGQSDEQLRSSLKKIERHYNRWLETMEGKNPDEAKGGASGGWSAKKVN